MQNQSLNPRQIEFILDSVAKINIAHGAISSGKTHAANVRFTQIAHNSPDSDLLICGYSIGSIKANIVGPFMEYNQHYTTFKEGGSCPILTFGDKRIRIVGANDQGAVGKIQGNSLSGVYVDEMTLIAQNFMDMLVSRLRKPHSILIGTSNPENPSHPIKKMIDEADGKNVYALHFEMDDNKFLPLSYRELVNKMYSGLWYRRYVLGQWVVAAGAIYDCFERKTHVVKANPNYPKFYLVGIDYGSVNPFAAVLISFNDKMTPSFCVEKELYWDPKSTYRQKTNSEFADMIEEFLYGIGEHYIYLDPSAEAFQIELRRRNIMAKAAENDVKNGISTVSNYLAQGDLVIAENCKHLIEEIEGYTWDQKKLKEGLEAPTKNKDHLLDALRYAIFSHFGRKTRLRQPEISPWELEKQMRIKMNQQNPFGEQYGWKKF